MVPVLPLRVHAASITTSCKPNAACYFWLSPFFGKSKNSLWLSFGLVKTGTNAGLL